MLWANSCLCELWREKILFLLGYIRSQQDNQLLKTVENSNSARCHSIFLPGNECTRTSMAPIEILFSGELLGLSTFETTRWDWKWPSLPMTSQKERRNRSCLDFSSCMHIYKHHEEQVRIYRQHGLSIKRMWIQFTSTFLLSLLGISPFYLVFPIKLANTERGEHEYWFRPSFWYVGQEL